jgi:hypothetical protein
MILEAYLALVLKHSAKVLLAVALLTLGFCWYAQFFRLDASADSLVVEGDADLEFSRVIDARYGTGDFVFVVYTPQRSLFSTEVLDDLRILQAELAALPGVASVDSILDVPLFKVANASLENVADNIITLATLGENADLEAARDDLMGNQAYRDVLLSGDGQTTALIVNFAVNAGLQELLATRSMLRGRERDQTLDETGRQQLRDVALRYTETSAQAALDLHANITAIRQILATHEDSAQIVMGGVPMIADDLITFVRSDLQNFGVAILLFIVSALAFLFAQIRYVLIPLVCGLVLTVWMIGLLGILNWPVTVISSNFIALLLIITVSLTVHLIVRYREIEQADPASTHQSRIREALRSMLLPCAYTSLTTLVAFASLVISDIPPIIDFGWMMVIGVAGSFVLSFLIFPALMALLPASRAPIRKHSIDITPGVARFTEKRGTGVLVAAMLLLLLSVAGMQKLRVENSFIDYFDESTAIYQGMVTIDTKMGGTTPLEVIVDLTRPNPFGAGDGFADTPEFDEFAWEDEEPESGAPVSDPDAYWFTSDKMARISAIHAWLDSLPETGKVLSLATLLELAYELNDNQVLNSLELGVLYNRIPEQYKETLLRPYVSVENDQVRFSLRIRETDETLVRGALLNRITEGLVTQFGLEPGQVQLTGMLVLYNNMLQSLFESQILTLSLVMGLIFLMFLILFRSLCLALLALIPNLIAALAILGLMGWLRIPLDMMTITIAAISVGIGVDNTIHYVHRFKSNFAGFGNYRQTMHYCHGSIGKAMYYTSFTIVAGFSILMLSNFVPTIYFGLLTSLAMLIALAGALTLLPQLLITFKPLGPENTGGS